MTVAIIDYGSGNLRSAAKAFERAARESGFRGNVIVTAAADQVAAAERIVLPGVGAFADCRRGLDAVPGMVDALADAVLKKGKPFLGICVGMQLMAERGLEHGETQGLGWLQGNVVALTPEGSESPGGAGFRVPHMGWNELNMTATGHPVFAGIPAAGHAYFVHSYHMQCHNPGHVLATVSYGQTVTAVVGRDNMIGTQFHPEKSQDVGLRFISNFLAWKP
ncbi:MAG: imidazole glycerol phosphate synthase subunit HisH [Rhodospirillaceae bacterium]|nr:imidazole glycerol phosphate synthase subunit HisH [Rhodospirillaceae bacterium]